MPETWPRAPAFSPAVSAIARLISSPDAPVSTPRVASILLNWTCSPQPAMCRLFPPDSIGTNGISVDATVEATWQLFAGRVAKYSRFFNPVSSRWRSSPMTLLGEARNCFCWSMRCVRGRIPSHTRRISRSDGSRSCANSMARRSEAYIEFSLRIRARSRYSRALHGSDRNA